MKFLVLAFALVAVATARHTGAKKIARQSLFASPTPPTGAQQLPADGTAAPFLNNFNLNSGPSVHYSIDASSLAGLDASKLDQLMLDVSGLGEEHADVKQLGSLSLSALSQLKNGISATALPALAGAFKSGGNVQVLAESNTPSSVDLGFNSVSSTTASPLGVDLGFNSVSSTTAAPLDVNLGFNSFSTTPAPLAYNNLQYSTTASPLAFNNLAFSTTQAPLSYNNLQYSTTASPVNTFLNSISTTPSPLYSNNLGLNNYNLGNLGISSYNQGQSGSYNLGNLGVSTYNQGESGNIQPIFQSNFNDQFQPESQGVDKHLYFYSAPEDEEIPAPRIILPQKQKKNVKVIFVKAPTFKHAPTPIIAPQALQKPEEKTVVYVLVKKPEAPAPIVLPTPPPTQPSKPEVVFIKYKNQQEAEQAVSEIQQQQNEGIEANLRLNNGVSGSSHYSSSDFLSSIGQGSIQERFGGLSPVNNFGFNTFSTSTASPISFNSFSTTPAPLLNGFNTYSSSAAPAIFNGFNTVSSTPAPLFNSGLYSTTAVPAFNDASFASSTVAPFNSGFNDAAIVSSTPAAFNFNSYSTTPSPLNKVNLFNNAFNSANPSVSRLNNGLSGFNSINSLASSSTPAPEVIESSTPSSVSSTTGAAGTLFDSFGIDNEEQESGSENTVSIAAHPVYGVPKFNSKK
ncbi:unnamed protein product [Brassicogethes aeneus]|uniref:DUF243 domain-containing protein n=1 Tax=Brassicogethes aeneus TaxID=1431903 RepID=A0A9P0FC12_BRAAE|nr:unnamed protein product [Brassicogethes aeneus]